MRYAVLFLSLSIASGGCGGAATTVSRSAERPPPRIGARGESTAHRLALAMERRLTVWTRPDGTPVYSPHCREAPGGCQARLLAFARMFVASGQRHGVDPYLLAGLSMRESGFNPGAIGRVGEAGIVQLHPRGEGHDIRFVLDSSYRRRCLRRSDACQGPVVDRGAEALARSEEVCGSVTRALLRYASGRCDRGGMPRVLSVLEERDRLRDASRRDDGSVASR